MKKQVFKPTFTSLQSCNLKAVSFAPPANLSDVDFGKRGPFFPFFAFICTFLLVLLTSNELASTRRSPRHTSFNSVESTIQSLNSHKSAFGPLVSGSSPGIGRATWKSKASSLSEMCTFESSVRTNLLRAPVDSAPCLSESVNKQDL